MRSAVIRTVCARELQGMRIREAAAARKALSHRTRGGSERTWSIRAALLGAACSIALEPAPVKLPHEDGRTTGPRSLWETAGCACWRHPLVGERSNGRQRDTTRTGARFRAMGFVPLVNATKKGDAVAESVVAASGRGGDGSVQCCRTDCSHAEDIAAGGR